MAAAPIALTFAFTGCGSTLTGPGGTDQAKSVSTADPRAGTATAAQPQATGSPLAGKVIVLDPGHNGGNAAHPEKINKPVDVITERKPCDTTGTETGAGYTEHAFTWDVAGRLAKLLRAQGAKVILTRSNDTGVGPCIPQRAAIGNDNKADAVLSIHADGAPQNDHGFHIIEPKPIKGHNEDIVPASQKLGLALRAAFHKGTDLPYSNYRGVQAIDRRDDLGGLNLSTRPKVFIECGNMANPGDAAKLSDPKFRQRIAQSLANGFTVYFS